MRQIYQGQSTMATLSANTQIVKHQVTWNDFLLLSAKLANSIAWTKYDSIYPIIRGGICLASELSSISNVPIVWELSPCKRPSTLIVDDICDSGATLEPFMRDGYDCAVLHYAGHSKPPTYYAEKSNGWMVYPWEESDEISKTVTRQIQYVGDNPGRAGVIETPKRVVKSWNELYRAIAMTLERFFPNSLTSPEATPPASLFFWRTSNSTPHANIISSHSLERFPSAIFQIRKLLESLNWLGSSTAFLGACKYRSDCANR